MIFGGMSIVVTSAAGWRTYVFYLVDINHCIVYLICPFWVSSYSGKYLFVYFIVKTGHVVQFPNLMALSHVSFVGNPAHAYRYLISCSMMGSLQMLLMDLPGSGQLIIMVPTFQFSTLDFNCTLYNPLVLHLHLVNTACLDAHNFTSFRL